MSELTKTKAKEYGLIVAAIIITVLIGLKAAHGQVFNYSEQEAMNRTRACLPADAAPATVSLSNVSAASSQLSANTVYYLVSTADTYIRFGSSAPTATTSHFLLTQRTYFPFVTGTQSGVRYVAGILASGTGTLYILKCQ
jgi:hypothetical protein